MSPSPSGTQCSSEQKDADEYVFLAVSGEHNTLVAGGAWQTATLKVENHTDIALKGVNVGLAKLVYEEGSDAYIERQKYVNLQQWDAKSRTWADIPWDESETNGLLDTVDLAPHETRTFPIRLNAEADFARPGSVDPDNDTIGWGYVGPYSPGPSDPDVCSYGNLWSVNVLKAGTDPGDGGATTPPPSSSEPTPQTGSTAPVTPTPASTTPTGDLAHTGSSSALPVIAGVGGAAVVLGAGAVYVVRRRKSGTDGTDAS
ncbi:LAETG motif-containing sortase-dependent surface protein [Streptomyces sp. SID12501]|uniref:LPXTG cell wall anchor domain-containing protein n=1 Tax=Streptomyces sp. SID12501 TaxID=2706042 RepID=A0A6B3BQ45_9ACTN|nr:LPXTG cell wall anchor domain-containing protein [Streptomyces sp. SID12501]